MKTRFVEVTNGFNWGKLLVAEFDAEEWRRPAQIGALGTSLLGQRGWTPKHRLILDIETGEGAIFLPGGYAKADLEKHKVWVCPMFEPCLTWLWEHWDGDLDSLPGTVNLTEEEAPSSMRGYRREGTPG